MDNPHADSSAQSLAVVLVSLRTPAVTRRAIESLREQCRAVNAPLIVARQWNDESDALEKELAGCIVVRCAATATVPELRGMGLAATRAEWVAMTEDNCEAAPDWLRELSRAFTPEHEVVGGTMTNARPERAVDGGAFFSEYGFFGTRRFPATKGGPPLVTGANVAYRHTVVERVRGWASAGAWENVIHERLAASGSRFTIVATGRVGQQLRYGLRAFCRDRYEHGRDYAATRTSGASLARRVAMAILAPALPPVLALRIYRSAGRDNPTAFLRALPATLAFLGAWTVGEIAGYLGGH